MKFRPLFLPTSSYQAYKQALDIGHQIKLIRERTNGSPVNDIPFGSVIVAALLDEALSRQNGIVSGISGLKVPEEEEGEYSLGLVSTICPPSRNEDNSSFIVSGFTEEKVHRFEVYNDYYGVLTVNWLGDDGDKFG